MAHVYQSYFAFLNNRVTASWRSAVNQPSVRRAESGMTRKWQLLRRCKESNPIISSRASRRQKECGLRQVRPSRKLLHLAIAETVAIKDYCDRITEIRTARKDIDLDETTLHKFMMAQLRPKTIGGDAGNRTRIQGFAGPCLSHSATSPCVNAIAIAVSPCV